MPAQAIGFVVAFLVAMPLAQAQNPASPADSLARSLPADNLALLIEYQGLDAHADAWKKTAACKILNNTTVGVMLEAVIAQSLDKLNELTKADPSLRTGAETVALFKHVAHSGFLMATLVPPDGVSKGYTALVIRNGYKDPAIRAIIAKNLNSMNAPNTKPAPLVRAGHKVISGVDKRGIPFAWWVEESKKEDIILVNTQLSGVDRVFETLDRKRPSLIDNPKRAELFKPENGFLPLGGVYVVPMLFQEPQIPPALGLGDIKRFDLRWGFQDEALMSVLRIGAPSPRKGLLGLFDGATFDRAKMIPIPEGVGDFTMMSVDPVATVDRLIALAKPFLPDVEDQWAKIQDAVKTRTKRRLKEDVLAHLGPKVACYVLPGKAPTTSKVAAPNMMSLVMASAGIDELPRAALVFDVDDPVAFGKVLDEAMAALNKELKARAVKLAGGDAVPAKGSRTKAPSAPSVEFRIVAGDAKMYVLSVPNDLANQFHPGFRPAIRVGPKHVAIAISSDVAKAALDAKGTWSAPGDLGAAMAGLSTKLRFLSVNDPRDTLPGLLAAFPGKLQKSVNMALLAQAGGAAPAPDAPKTPPPGGGNGGGGSGKPMAAGTVGGNPTPGSTGTGTPGVEAGANTPTPGGSSFIVQYDAAKLPSAEAIKGLLFPSMLAVESNEGEIRIVSRSAFPTVPDVSKLSTFGTILMSLQSGKGLPPGMTPPPPSTGGASAGIPGKPGTGANAGGGGNRPTKPD